MLIEFAGEEEDRIDSLATQLGLPMGRVIGIMNQAVFFMLSANKHVRQDIIEKLAKAWYAGLPGGSETTRKPRGGCKHA